MNDIINSRIASLSVPSRIGIETSLTPIRQLLKLLGNPERNFRVVHVGGTSGKGSTSTFIASILNQAGYRVGLYTKPHLITARERFVINGECISTEELLVLLDKIAPYAQIIEPTWFELLTALGFFYFSDQKVDVAVIEVGLGGRLDATNILLPDLAVLTNVGLDHTGILGETIEQIANEKAGIIKASGAVVSGPKQSSVRKIVQSHCDKLSAKLYLIDRDFSYSISSMSKTGSSFSFVSAGKTFDKLNLRVIGEHQIENASLAIMSSIHLSNNGYVISDANITEAMASISIPGRLEVVHLSPTILLDGAHSPPKMESLAKTLSLLFVNDYDRIIGLLAFSAGHDAFHSLSFLAPFLDIAILTQFDAHTDYPETLAQDLKKLNDVIQIYIEPDPFRALDKSLTLAQSDDLICGTGSIYLVGQLRSCFIK